MSEITKFLNGKPSLALSSAYKTTFRKTGGQRPEIKLEKVLNYFAIDTKAKLSTYSVYHGIEKSLTSTTSIAGLTSVEYNGLL